MDKPIIAELSRWETVAEKAVKSKFKPTIDPQELSSHWLMDKNLLISASPLSE